MKPEGIQRATTISLPTAHPATWARYDPRANFTQCFGGFNLLQASFSLVESGPRQQRTRFVAEALIMTAVFWFDLVVVAAVVDLI